VGCVENTEHENVVKLVRGQLVEEEIGRPQYLLGATGEVAVSLRQEPARSLPLPQPIFFHGNNDILAWLLANQGQDALDLLVVESRRKNRDDGAQTPEPAKGRYRFLNRNVWEDAVGIMQAYEDEDDDEDDDEDEEEGEEEEAWLEAESEGERQAPRDGGAIVLDQISIDT